jgi:hypothetical protein
MGRGPIDGSAGGLWVVPGWLTAGVAVKLGNGNGSRAGGDGLIAEQAAKQTTAKANPSLMRLIHQGAALRSAERELARRQFLPRSGE